MSVTLSPYLSFRGNAREAITFYHSVFGGDMTISTFEDFNASQEPSEKNLVMHSTLTTVGGLTLMASDRPLAMDYTPGDNYSIILNSPHTDEEEMRGYWSRLVVDGTISMPLTTSMWGDTFGMCTDTFGVSWLMNISVAPAA